MAGRPTAPPASAPRTIASGRSSSGDSPWSALSLATANAGKSDEGGVGEGELARPVHEQVQPGRADEERRARVRACRWWPRPSAAAAAATAAASASQRPIGRPRRVGRWLFGLGRGAGQAASRRRGPGGRPRRGRRRRAGEAADRPADVGRATAGTATVSRTGVGCAGTAVAARVGGGAGRNVGVDGDAIGASAVGADGAWHRWRRGGHGRQGRPGGVEGQPEGGGAVVTGTRATPNAVRCWRAPAKECSGTVHMPCGSRVAAMGAVQSAVGAASAVNWPSATSGEVIGHATNAARSGNTRVGCLHELERRWSRRSARRTPGPVRCRRRRPRRGGPPPATNVGTAARCAPGLAGGASSAPGAGGRQHDGCDERDDERGCGASVRRPHEARRPHQQQHDDEAGERRPRPGR